MDRADGIAVLIVLVVIAIQMVYVIRELQKANRLAQQAITQRVAIADLLTDLRGEW